MPPAETPPAAGTAPEAAAPTKRRGDRGAPITDAGGVTEKGDEVATRRSVDDTGDGGATLLDGGAAASGDFAVGGPAGGGDPPSGPPPFAVAVASGSGDGKIRLGHFVLGKAVGGGAYGTVFRSRDTRLHRRVAVKVFAPRGDGEGAADGFAGIDPVLHEARAAARLEHPNVARVILADSAEWTAALRAKVAAGRRNGDALLPPAGGEAGYIVSEFVGGGTLARQFRRYHDEEFGDDETPAWATPWGAVRFLLPVAGALAHAHANNVVHRDVKPANVLLRKDGTPVLTDFGIARATAPPADANASTMLLGGPLPGGSGTLSADGRILGTPAYMAPEQAKPWGVVGPPADVYSLGVVLWELLAGERMYRGDAAEVLDRIVSAPAPPLPTKVPKPIRRLVERCLAKIAGDRFADGFALAAAMREVLPPEDSVWTRRRMVAAGVGGLGVVGAGALAGWATREERDPRLRPSVSGWEPGQPPAGPVPAGRRRVRVDTKPRGAAAWLIPLDGGGQPAPAGRIDLPTRTPAEVDVPPGAYLLVAEGAVGGPGGAERPVWHEAVRHVPPVGRKPFNRYPAYGFSLGGDVAAGESQRPVLLRRLSLFADADVAALWPDPLAADSPRWVSMPTRRTTVTVPRLNRDTRSKSYAGGPRLVVPGFEALSGPLPASGAWRDAVPGDLLLTPPGPGPLTPVCPIVAEAIVEALGLRLPDPPEWTRLADEELVETNAAASEWLAGRVEAPPAPPGVTFDDAWRDGRFAWKLVARDAPGDRTVAYTRAMHAAYSARGAGATARGVRSGAPRRDGDAFVRPSQTFNMGGDAAPPPA